VQLVPAPTQAAAAASSSSNGFLGATSASSSSCDYTAPVLQPSTELPEPSILHEQPEPSIPISTPNLHDNRPTRSRRLPMRFRDELPVPPPAIPQPPPSTLPRVILHVFDSFRTTINEFGIGREYRHRPTHDPDAFVSVDQLSNVYPSSSPNAELSSSPEVASSSKPPPWPWKNMSVWRLMTWMLTGSNQTSHAQATRLVKEVLSAEDFQIDDVKGFNAQTEMRRLDSSEAQLNDNDIYRRDGWKEIAAEILVPTREKNPDGNGQPFTIPGFQYRPLIAVIHAAFSEATSKWFHFTPFKRFWKSPVTGQEQRLHDELYTSDAWIKAHDDLQKQRRDDGCKLEKVIAGLMFWSDSTHLAQFGNASAWPVYLYFGNQSKYTRSCPTSGACHLVALIPSVSVPIHTSIVVLMVDNLSLAASRIHQTIYCDDYLD
jgi:Plavaka transposase